MPDKLQACKQISEVALTAIVAILLTGVANGCANPGAVSKTAPQSLQATSPTPVGIAVSATPRIAGVVVTTDRREYSLVETVVIAIRNDTDRSVWYLASPRIWSLERMGPGDRWSEVNISLPVSDSLSAGEKCIFIAYERPEPSELRPGSALRAEWRLGNICEWPLEPIGVPTVAPKPPTAGSYRVSFIYGLDKAEDSISTNKEYSSSFVIH
ncbi:MAG: hypothetical protein HY675_26195 [Chloroflexi bacterium]|nr:hypothetical protein [Chloroflexota bacterium]